jgi:hypothetical protein
MARLPGPPIHCGMRDREAGRAGRAHRRDSQSVHLRKGHSGSADYDSNLNELEAQGDHGVMALYERLAIEDIQRVADALRPVYEATKRRDGYVSLEVSPYLAMDTEATIAEARRLWQAVGSDNLMIKVPGTKPGLPAIRGAGEGSPADRLFRFRAGFRRGSVDDRGRDRGGGSGGRAGGGVVRALPLAAGPHLRRKDALGHASRLRRPHREQRAHRPRVRAKRISGSLRDPARRRVVSWMTAPPGHRIPRS